MHILSFPLLPTTWQGFFDAGSPWADVNPGKWATGSGQAFAANHALKDIDFTTVGPYATS
jgi:hypothetical protein